MRRPVTTPCDRLRNDKYQSREGMTTLYSILRTNLLALSSSVLSIHCTEWVIRGSWMRVIKCLPRAQHRSDRIGFRLYGIALDPDRSKTCFCRLLLIHYHHNVSTLSHPDSLCLDTYFIVKIQTAQKCL